MVEEPSHVKTIIPKPRGKIGLTTTGSVIHPKQKATYDNALSYPSSLVSALKRRENPPPPPPQGFNPSEGEIISLAHFSYSFM
jgi:hypothetical protein